MTRSPLSRLAPLLLVALLCIAVSVSLTLTGPTWNPTTAFTNNTLTCTWSYSGDTATQNITVLRNGVVYNSTFQNISVESLSTSSVVSADNTTKGDIWTCRILLSDNSTTSQAETNVTILNSPPVLRGLPAGIFNSSGSDIGDIVQVLEDATYIYDSNATDADGDTVTYGFFLARFCTITDSNNGLYSCTPNQANLTNNLPTLQNVSFAAQDSSDGATRIITFNITPVNDAPTATVTNQTVAVNVSLNYTFTAADEEPSYPLNASLYFNDSNTEIQSAVALTCLDTNCTSMSFTYTGTSPDYNDVGVWPIMINLSDAGYANTTLRFDLNISAVGRAPYFVLITPNGTHNLTEDVPYQINLSANDPDANSSISFTDDSTLFTTTTTNPWTNTTNATAQINYTPVNADVGVFNVTITITSAGQTNTTILTFNVTNVNDAPVLHEISSSSANTQNNTNMSALIGYTSAPFIYDVNATDDDSIHGDSLNYTDNTTLFNISSTGRINFTPVAGQEGTYDINITVTDESGAQASRTATLTINLNSPPRFTQELPGLNCTTGSACTFNISNVSTDPDGGDSVVGFTVALLNGTLGGLSYNSTTGLIDFTPQKAEVGNYTLNLTISDTFGATNSTLMNLSINNTPTAPTLTRYNFSTSTIVETFAFSYELQANDTDFLLPSSAETVNFTTNLSITHQITPIATSNITAGAQLVFTPADGDAGNYTIQINATDGYGLVSTQVITFEILPDVPPPNITTITPWGAPPTFAIQTTYTDATNYSASIVNVTLNESTVVLFNITVNDTRPLTYNWTFDGGQVSTLTNYTRNFTYFSAGNHLVRVNVSNDRYESVAFTWNLTVADINRAPQQSENLTTTVTVNGTLAIANFFTFGSSTRFYDPDDDLNSDGDVQDTGEVNTLTFAASSSCSVATFSISGPNLTVEGTEEGSCQLYFNATDTGGLTLQSNLVTINITDITEGASEAVTVVSSGGGGGSSSRSTVVPILRNDVKPQAFHLITPKLVSLYRDTSIEIPVIINNTWDGDLEFLTLTAESNATGVTTSFDTEFFDVIPKGELREVTLTVEGYRLGENYEVKVVANVTDPAYQDEALILLNSIERSQEGEEVDVKVTFANDLINQHPECQELNEVLTTAKQRLADNDVTEAGRLVDTVISGCKYLVGLQERNLERPSRVGPLLEFDSITTTTLLWSVLAFFVLASIALVVYYHFNKGPEDEI